MVSALSLWMQRWKLSFQTDLIRFCQPWLNGGFMRANRPLSLSGHVESRGNKKLCLRTASLGQNSVRRLPWKNEAFYSPETQHGRCVIKVYQTLVEAKTGNVCIALLKCNLLEVRFQPQIASPYIVFPQNFEFLGKKAECIKMKGSDVFWSQPPYKWSILIPVYKRSWLFFMFPK